MTMSAEVLRRQKESDWGQGGTGSQGTVAIPEDKGDAGLQHLCLDGWRGALSFSVT